MLQSAKIYVNIPEMTHTEALKVRGYASANRALLSESKLAGCYVCFKIFRAVEVIEYTKNSAVCPHCWVDAVLPDKAAGVEMDYLYLKSIYDALYAPLAVTKNVYTYSPPPPDRFPSEEEVKHLVTENS